MILDTSAVAAIFLGEPEQARFTQLIHDAERCRVSAATFVELSIILERRAGAHAVDKCERFFRQAGIEIEPLTADHAHLARQAYHDFGEGRHPAGLNLGDCFAYALSKATGEPLLFKGDDFRKTDVIAAD